MQLAGSVCLWLCVCVREWERERERERDCPCVRECVMCVSGVVWLLMLTGNHVSGSVISESDWKLEAGRQRQTRLSRRNYGAGIWSLKTTRKKKKHPPYITMTKSFDEVFFSPVGDQVTQISPVILINKRLIGSLFSFTSTVIHVRLCASAAAHQSWSFRMNLLPSECLP